jgi:hypothetical protein
MRTLLCLACAALPLAAQEPVWYVVSFPNTAHHEAQVRATFAGVRQAVLEVLMSRSSPGPFELRVRQYLTRRKCIPAAVTERW